MKGKRNEKRSKKSAILKQHARNLFVGVVIVLFVSMSFSAFFVSAKENTPYVLIYTLQPTAVRNRSNTHFYRLSYNIDQSIRQILIFPKDMDVKIYI